MMGRHIRHVGKPQCESDGIVGICIILQPSYFPKTEIDSLSLLSNLQYPHTSLLLKPGSTTTSVAMLPMLRSRQINVCPGPKVAQVTDGEVQSDSHLASHDDETHVPSKKGHDEEQCTASLLNKLAEKVDTKSHQHL